MPGLIPIKLAEQAMANLEAENARLMAECQARQAENSVLAVECDSLKAEVERLTSDLQMEKENEDRLVREWQKANNEVYGRGTQIAALIDNQTRLKAEVERLTDFTTRTIIPNEELQAQVERLTKAGDAMAEALLFEDDMSCKEIADWNAAKEGKQS